MQLVILASGTGSRLKNKTKKIPKCLVKINGIPIIDYNKKFFDKFKKVVIVTGYKSQLIKKKFLDKKYKIIFNKKYKSTNMVYSLFCASKYINNNVVISYADIIFDKNIFNLFMEHGESSIIIYKNWLKLWKKRMNKKKILKDAENLTLKNNYVENIGEKINKDCPKYQFMGLLKLTKLDFNKLNIFFKKIKNNKIDLTNFLNMAISKKIIRLRGIKTNKYWFEIDVAKDIVVAKQELYKFFNKW